MPANVAPIDLPQFYALNSGISDSSVLRTVLSHIPYVVFWKDRECRYLGCNLQFAALAGLDSPEDIVGLTDFDLPWETEVAIAYRACDMEIMTTDTPKLHRVETRLSLDGVKRSVDMSKAPLRNRSGEVVGIIGVNVDVTENIAVATTPSQSSKLESLGRLAAGIGHEINTPAQFAGDNVRYMAHCFEDLMGFISKAKTLAAAVAHGDACSELASEMLRDIDITDLNFIDHEFPTTFAQTLDGIEYIRNIALSMKEYSYSNDEQVESVDINHLIRNTVTVATKEWRYVAQVELALDNDIPLIQGVREHISQALLNLIINAAHAIEEANAVTAGRKPLGKIVIASVVSGSDIEIKVKDTGTGIHPELHETIFDPYFSSTKVGERTGQGLSISHNLIVDGHGGSISFATEAGIGTTFTILLPIEGIDA